MRKRAYLRAPELFEARFCLDGTGLGVVAAVADEAEGEPQADFSLEDTNSTSSTFGQDVSPSDFRGHASAWYFGQAT